MTRHLNLRLKPRLGEAEPGMVETFDEDKGLGVVINPVGDWYPFHCTAIADGSRRIDAGRQVMFIVGPAGPGRWEACHVVPVSPLGTAE